MMWRGLTRGGGASDGDALVELRRTGQRLPPAGLFEAILRQRRDWVREELGGFGGRQRGKKILVNLL